MSQIQEIVKGARVPEDSGFTNNRKRKVEGIKENFI